jgi:hypothetical protein
MNSEHPAYYAIIPASVRYDDNLSPAAKLLFGEITALCSISGYCWATNAYFARIYKTSERSVSRWISELIDQHHIKAKVVVNNVGTSRHLFPSGLDKNVVHIITSSITSNNKSAKPKRKWKGVGFDEEIIL